MNEHLFCECTKLYEVPKGAEETNIVFYADEVPAEAIVDLSNGKGEDVNE